MPIRIGNITPVVYPKIYVPKSIHELMVHLGNTLSADVEYSIITQGEWTEKGFVVKPVFHVPYQKVSVAFIQYLENLDVRIREGWNVIIHKHPTGIEHFSGTDMNSINKYFPASLLFENGEFREATVMFRTPDNKRIIMPIEIELYDDGTDLVGQVTEDDLKKIIY